MHPLICTIQWFRVLSQSGWLAQPCKSNSGVRGDSGLKVEVQPRLHSEVLSQTHAHTHIKEVSIGVQGWHFSTLEMKAKGSGCVGLGMPACTTGDLYKTSRKKKKVQPLPITTNFSVLLLLWRGHLPTHPMAPSVFNPVSWTCLF